MLKNWEMAHDHLMDLYRQSARERDRGYDRPDTNESIDRAETIEHEAWIAYRESGE